jgi:hypothetical protein
MVHAKLISTEGPYLEAVIEVGGQLLHVIDEFTVSAETAPKIGEEFEFEFSSFIDEDEPWEEIFSGNPEHRKELKSIAGWKYKAFGQVMQINPVVVDCGLFQIEGIVSSNDQGLVGEWVAFTITRLGGYAYTT